MKSYKLSVRLMTYNHGNYIEEALKGIDIQKTDFSFEVVVGDDFSADDTLSKIRVYNFTNPNLDLRILEREVGDSYHKQRKKKGRLYNFVDILNNCTGEYIALLDGDDYWTDPLKLQKQVDFLENNEDFVLNFHEAKIINNNQTIQDCYVSPSLMGVLNNKRLKEGPYILPITLCFRNVIKDYPEEFYKVPNGDVFLISMLGNFGKGYFISDIEKACYRHHASGMWSSQSQLNKLVNQLTTYYWLKVFYNKKGDNTMTQYFYNKFYSRSFYFMEHLSSFSQDLQVSNRFFLDKHYTMSFWYILYKGVKKATGKGHFLRRKFLTSLSEA